MASADLYVYVTVIFTCFYCDSVSAENSILLTQHLSHLTAEVKVLFLTMSVSDYYYTRLTAYFPGQPG